MQQEINAKAKIHSVDPPLYQSARTQGVSLTLPLVITSFYPPRKEGVLIFTGTEDPMDDGLLRRLRTTNRFVTSQRSLLAIDSIIFSNLPSPTPQATGLTDGCFTQQTRRKARTRRPRSTTLKFCLPIYQRQLKECH